MPDITITLTEAEAERLREALEIATDYVDYYATRYGLEINERAAAALRELAGKMQPTK
jgi:hypothetical protein